MRNHTWHYWLALGITSILSGLGIYSIALATTCPEPDSIVSNNPDAADFATYLADGWHSNQVPIVDLPDTTFDEAYIDDVGVKCVYITPNSYLTLYRSDGARVDSTMLVGNSTWQCVMEQSPLRITTTGRVCTCSVSPQVCAFTFK